MQDRLANRGWKGTRILSGTVLCAMVTAGYIWGDVSADQWLNFLMWGFGTYAASEVGAKGAEAYRDRN